MFNLRSAHFSDKFKIIQYQFSKNLYQFISLIYSQSTQIFHLILDQVDNIDVN